MIDPITAIAAATAAFNGVKQLINAGRDLEDVAGQLGKWYGAAADLGKAEQQRKNPPLFKKLLSSGSIEEEALSIIIHKKKLAEQEKELASILDFRFGPGTWQEMIQIRRQIKKERDQKIYKQQELKQTIIDSIVVLVGLIVSSSIVFGIVYMVGLAKYWW
jgi:replicative DNA helicase